MYSVDNWIVRHHKYFYYNEEVKHFQFFKKIYCDRNAK